MDPKCRVNILEFLKHQHKDKQKTYSGYKRSQVWSSFQKELLKKNIDQALNWYVELLVSAQSLQLFDKLIGFYMREINIANPNLPSYLLSEYILFTETINNLDCDHQIIANHQVIRNHLCEIISILCLSNKQKIIKTIKLKKTEFTPITIRQKIEANRETWFNNIWKKDDCQDFFIPLNEFTWHLSVTKNKSKALYWISWILEWYKMCNKKSSDLECSRRPIDGVSKKYWNSFVWIIWEIIIWETKTRKNNKLLKQIRAIYSLYRYNFKKSNITSRFNYIATAIVFLTKTLPPIDFKLKIYSNYSILVNINCKINAIFEKIGKNRTWFIKKKIQNDFYNDEFMKTIPKKKVANFPNILNIKKNKKLDKEIGKSIYLPGDVYKKAIEKIRENKKVGLEYYEKKQEIIPTQKIENKQPIINKARQERERQMLQLSNFLYKKKPSKWLYTK